MECNDQIDVDVDQATAFLEALNLQPPPTKETLSQQSFSSTTAKSPKPNQSPSKTRSSIDFGPFVEFNTREGFLSVHLQDRSVNDEVVKQLISWISQRLQKWKTQQISETENDNNNSPQKVKASPKKKKVKVLRTLLVLYENDISDEGVQSLTAFILGNTDSIKVKHLKLWKNKISDIGAAAIADLIAQCPYAIQEIHLSHNRITTEGAKSILGKVHASSLYPRQSQKDCYPLWLRLEFNFINNEEIIKYLNGLQPSMSYCLARDRSRCGPSSCVRISKSSGGMTSCKVHLYVFELQYKEIEQSLKLIQTKKKIQQLKDKKKIQASPSASEAIPEISSQVPTYIFLDTCAVLNMIEYSNPKNNVHVSKVFTLKNLIEKANQQQFGECFENDGDKTYLIITDTVMQEIDHQKKYSPALRSSIIKYLQSEDSYINQAIHLNFLECLGSHQGEVLLKHQSQEAILAMKHIDNKNLQNDIMLINLALFWNAEIGETGNVIVISADKDVTRRAKLHNLPAEQLHVLDQNIALHGLNAPWTAAVIKQCIPNAYKQGGKPIGSPIQSKSIYSEFQAAINTTSYLLAENEKLHETLQEIRKKVEWQQAHSDLNLTTFLEELFTLTHVTPKQSTQAIQSNIQQWETIIAQKPSSMTPKKLPKK